MNFADFERHLKQTMGLEAASIGAASVERAVRERLSLSKLNDLQAYWDYLLKSETELQELIEAVVVPETWFFRDREAFKELAHLALQEWLPTHPAGMLRLLSLPCSSGEEAYSMVMALLEAGLPADRFRVDGMDISTRALTAADHAVYGKNSFRCNDLGFREHYLEATPQGYRMNDGVRQKVNFRQGNVLDGELLAGLEPYEFIFCRNLLIYFDSITQDRVIEALHGLLSEQGVLFVGSAEASLLLKHKFVSVKAPMAFAFRKVASARPELMPVVNEVPAQIIPFKATAALPAFRSIRHLPNPRVELNLDDAARLADEGRFKEAVTCCEDFLRSHPPSAKAFYLLGLVRDAGGYPTEAADYYRKALYLDPQHHDALVHLALLLEKLGDKAGSKVLHERAGRLEQEEKA